tara:strand:- start:196 stop:306 length:111 start_codon:yes stop_codon:yes gene_type:complete
METLELKIDSQKGEQYRGKMNSTPKGGESLLTFYLT